MEGNPAFAPFFLGVISQSNILMLTNPTPYITLESHFERMGTMKAPGKSHRKGLTLLEIADMFGDEVKARQWIEQKRWPEGPHCPRCGAANIKVGVPHKSMTHRCNDCAGKPMFSVKIGTCMEGSKLKYRVWAIGIYLFTTNIKGISSMRLHRELGIGQKAAWFMLQRLCLAYEADTGPFADPVEIDETYMGGKRKNMPKAKRRDIKGRGAVGKVAVIGAKDRATNRVTARPVANTNATTMQGFAEDNTMDDAKVYTDDAAGYRGMARAHEAVCHSVGEYVRGQAHTNSIESFWALLKRGHSGVYHKISPKHLDRYVNEFAGRHNNRDADTTDQMARIVIGMAGRRLRYRELIADNGLASGARS